MIPSAKQDPPKLARGSRFSIDDCNQTTQSEPNQQFHQDPALSEAVAHFGNEAKSGNQHEQQANAAGDRAELFDAGLSLPDRLRAIRAP